MEKIKVFINDFEYEIDYINTIYNICEDLGIDIPTLYLENDISYVSVNGEIINANLTNVENNMSIYTNTQEIQNLLENRINNMHDKTIHNCLKCPVINCNLLKMYNKFNLSLDKGNTYKECEYYLNGVKQGILKVKEQHVGLEEILKDKSIHKVAIIDRKMSPKKAEILSRGFNEVITNDFVKKFKIIEESALILEEIAKGIDKRENKLPCCVLEDKSLINKVPFNLRKNIINVGTIEELTKRILTCSVDFDKVKCFFIKEDEFDNETNEIITLDYLLTLPLVDNIKVDNIQKLLKLDDKEVNYNTFVKHMLDIFKSKRVKSKQDDDLDIYQTSLCVINTYKKDIVIVNANQLMVGDIILFLSDEPHQITDSIIDDNDVNYIYKNYIKYPGNL